LPMLDVPTPASEPLVPDVVMANVDAEPASPPDAPIEGADGRGVPSLLGLSLREALTRAHAGAWTVDVDGHGYVATQRPAPGTAVPTERHLTLTLAADTERHVR